MGADHILNHREDMPAQLRALGIGAVEHIFCCNSTARHFLAMAEMMGDYPAHLLLIGVQPVELDDYGGSLRPEVKAQIAPAIDAALKFLANHGVTATRRAQPLREDVTIASQEMALSRYEEGRPDAGEACRHGDQRVIAGQGWQGPRDFEAEITEILGKPKAEA